LIFHLDFSTFFFNGIFIKYELLKLSLPLNYSSIKFMFIIKETTISYHDSSWFQWLNPNTILDYFCNVQNPFYNVECNNQVLKMQGMGPDQLK
jgi:hypothetical protein